MKILSTMAMLCGFAACTSDLEPPPQLVLGSPVIDLDKVIVAGAIDLKPFQVSVHHTEGMRMLEIAIGEEHVRLVLDDAGTLEYRHASLGGESKLAFDLGCVTRLGASELTQLRDEAWVSNRQIRQIDVDGAAQLVEILPEVVGHLVASGVAPDLIAAADEAVSGLYLIVFEDANQSPGERCPGGYVAPYKLECRDPIFNKVAATCECGELCCPAGREPKTWAHKGRCVLSIKGIQAKCECAEQCVEKAPPTPETPPPSSSP